MSDRRFGIIAAAIVALQLVLCYAIDMSRSKQPVKCDCKCRCHEVRPKPGETYIDENTDIPNNPLKPLTEEEFKQLQEMLRKARKPEVGDAP